MNNDAAQKRWEAAQKAAVANFKPITRTYTISKCPGCYGSLPQGNESAWAKGCKECNLMDECGKVTHDVWEASMSDEEWNEDVARIKNFMHPDMWQKKYGNGRAVK